MAAMRPTIVFTVSGGHFFPAPVNISCRSDRTAGLILRKCLLQVEDDGKGLPDTLLTPTGKLVDLSMSTGEVESLYGTSLALGTRPICESGEGALNSFDVHIGSEENEQLEAMAPSRTGAWECDGSSNSELVNNLRNSHVFSAPRVGAALLAVDRALFVR